MIRLATVQADATALQAWLVDHYGPDTPTGFTAEQLAFYLDALGEEEWTEAEQLLGITITDLLVDVVRTQLDPTYGLPR